MPTKNPRMMISVSPEARKALAEWRESTGYPASQFVTQLIEESIPVLLEMAKAFRHARKNRTYETIEAFSAIAEGAMHKAAQLQLDMQDAKNKHSNRPRLVRAKKSKRD